MKLTDYIKTEWQFPSLTKKINTASAVIFLIAMAYLYYKGNK
jgi:hypothetical protein